MRWNDRFSRCKEQDRIPGSRIDKKNTTFTSFYAAKFKPNQDASITSYGERTKPVRVELSEVEPLSST